MYHEVVLAIGERVVVGEAKITLLESKFPIRAVSLGIAAPRHIRIIRADLIRRGGSRLKPM